MILVGAIRGQSNASQRVIDAMAIALMGFALVLVLGQDNAKILTFERAFVSDGFSRFMKVLTLAGSMMAVLLAIDFMKRRGSIEKFEYPILITLATLGMMMMISANDLISLYIGLELQSLAPMCWPRSTATTRSPPRPASSISSSARCRRACCSTAPR